MTERHIGKTNMTGEWQPGKYYEEGDEFTYKTKIFHVTENHRSCEEFHPRNELCCPDNEESNMPFKLVKEAKDVGSFEAK